jgi:CRISPR-associated protein Cmr1
MKSITFTCEVITPMFLAGADGSTPELRPASIKGALRFWWRAMNGHLELAEMKKREGEIFGGTDKGMGRSCFTVRLTNRQNITVVQAKSVPHKNNTSSSIQHGTRFDITFSILPFKGEGFVFGLDELKSLFELTAILGGYGKRSRRAMGCVKINSTKEPIDVKQYEKTIDNSSVLSLLQKHSTHYKIQGESIFLSYQGTMQPYPWIRQIQIGEESDKNIPNHTSDVTHQLHGKYGQSYEPNLGHANRGRFASPVIVSVYDNANTPIITTLNAIPDRGDRDLDKFIQDDFKNNIL